MNARRPNRPRPARCGAEGKSARNQAAEPAQNQARKVGGAQAGTSTGSQVRKAAGTQVEKSAGSQAEKSAARPAKPKAAGKYIALAAGRNRNRPRAATQTRSASGRTLSARTPSGRSGDPKAVREKPGRTRPQSGRWDSPKTLIVAFVLVLAVLGMVQPMHAWWVQQREYRAIMNQIDTTRTKNQELQAELDRWSSKEYVASQARARLQMVMPGETQYAVVDPGDHAVPVSSAQAVEAHGPQRPWYLTIADSVDAADDPKSLKVIAPKPVQEKPVEENE